MSDFFSFSTVHQAYFKAHGQVHHYKKGQIFTHRQEVSRDVYFLESGYVKVGFSTKDATERVLSIVLPGMTFAQVGSFYAMPQTELEFEAYSDIVIYRIPRDRFLIDLTHDQQLFYDWYRRTAENQLFWIELLTCCAERKPRDRILSWLTCMVRYFSITTGGKATIEMPLSQETIAAMTMLTRESTNKVIHELKRLGIITVKDKHITIPNVEALDKLARA